MYICISCVFCAGRFMLGLGLGLTVLKHHTTFLFLHHMNQLKNLSLGNSTIQTL
jgi:hypothetical protein